ncbi:ATP-binding cassette domain-containing protein [Conexibacter sp. JD483]|uniref:ABC transporter ATP-binding protein n=1 Tax=unclassified Conexibacter TaxID=2627773 RepID=UPI002719CCE9|nr:MULTISPECIES: ATP-binding cassette domain-containing protein [unclassified Conexibacter]MDO8184492.1 ATP-binding cassette domain-containing protein [Conexibacter sp. CPCC 205706]MDO8197798.1 ATP-binding cassette domain-containing protein [Conexibacter sp. CPCC 205762]MDR9369204.1 ATP-binding cassette domain-containing protein [Conexibacter sp. JD483]
MLELDALVKRYRGFGGETICALDGVSMTVTPGELIALYGPSGSGKTTLLAIVAALMRPDSGCVVVDGVDVVGLGEQDAARYRRLELGYVGQSLELIAGVPAIDNAALKLFDTRIGVREAHRRVVPLLDRLGLGQRLRHRGDQLSAGERQRVLIARALATDPKLVVADEPTGSLDTERSREVLTLLRELCEERGVAMLLATHDPQAAAFATRTRALLDGRLVDRLPDVPLAGLQER